MSLANAVASDTVAQINALKAENAALKQEVNNILSGRMNIIMHPTEQSSEACSICLEESTNCTIQTCGHKFHCDCLVQMVDYTSQYKCPMCRMTFRRWSGDCPIPKTGNLGLVSVSNTII